MSFSYFLSWESPQADTFLWSTLSTAFHNGAKLLIVDELETGINMIFDKELSQTDIMETVLSVIIPQELYTPGDNISSDTSGQAGDS